MRCGLRLIQHDPGDFFMELAKRSNAGLLAWRLVVVLLLLGLALAGGTAPAQAGGLVYMDNYSEEVHWTFVNPCAAGGAGEDVVLDGVIHYVFNEVSSSSGNAVYKSMGNPQGLIGVGVDTGDVYRATGMTQGISTVKDTNDVYTSINSFHFIGPGPGSNFILHSTFHLTFNANGELTAYVDNYSSECR
jgi:hypothetical protein